MIRRLWAGASVPVALLLALLTGGPAPAAGQVAATEYEGATSLGLVLRQLGTTKRVLMIAAHPDDEQTQLLSTLALGQGADVAYLSLTRGEGGQNGIGPELQEALGLLRSEELLSARRLDGARQFFTRAVDWGYSRSADEAFRMWPGEEVLGDVVAVVRDFRPDVIVSVFSGTARDGHGQHQAAGILAELAFEAAADPDRFPAHLAAGIRPHAPAHLYQLVRGGPEVPAVEVATGRFDPLLGASPFQVAMASRSRHRSQDMGRLLTPGPQWSSLSLAATRTAGHGQGGLFAGVDTTLSAIAARSLAGGWNGAEPLTDLLVRYEETVGEILRIYNPLAPESASRLLAGAAAILDETLALREASAAPGDALLFHLRAQRAVVEEALLRAAGVVVDATLPHETLVPGQTVPLEVSVWNGGADPIEVATLEPRLPAGWSVTPRTAPAVDVQPGLLVTQVFEVTVSRTAEPTEPYFLRLPRQGAFYTWPDGKGPVGLPFEADPVRVGVGLRIAGVPVRTEATASFQGLDPRSGEYRRPIRVVPAVSVTAEPAFGVVPLARRGDPIPVVVRVQGEDPAGLAGSLRLEAPEGWRAAPQVVPIRFAGRGEEHLLEFTVFPVPDLRPGRVTLTAVFEDAAGRRFDRGYALIDYPHIRPRPHYQAATIDLELLDVELPPGVRVGYVAAAGDNVPQAIAQLGAEVELLGPRDLAGAPLDHYDVIVVGIRAYGGRPDLITHNHRLLEYVRRGGTMIVQYNQYDYTAPGIAPYPISMARPHDRVTDHEAPVHFLDPDHPLLTWPNRITTADFAGWVQERGLYFLHTWDERYRPLLEMADPGEPPTRGSLLVAPLGEGTYVYVGLALFRQLPAGVPGAYRLLANLLALGAR
jgi:LmbE family N-acetylglucosaminyl deacetylase